MKKIFAALLISLLPYTAFAGSLCGFDLNYGESLVIDEGTAYALDADITNMSDDDVKSELEMRGIVLGDVSDSNLECLEKQEFFVIWRILRCIGGKGRGC
jgi:hypothetical protein